MIKKFFLLVLCATILLGCKKERKQIVVCWGDSLTMQHKDYGIRGNIKKWISGNFIDDSYPGFLEEILGDKYEVVNCGVGGESTTTIAARQGSIPMFLNKDILFGEGEEEILLENDVLRSSWDSSIVAPLHQSRWKEGSPARINPCMIDKNKLLLKCNRIENADTVLFKYSLERGDKSKNKITIRQGAIFMTEASKHLRNSYVNIFFVGQNGGYKDISDYAAQLKRMVAFGVTQQYIVISFHKPNHVLSSIDDMREMEKTLLQNFGKHYINLREYMVNRGLKDARLTAEKTDKDSILHGQVPPQLMTDGTHFNAHANRLIATLVERKMKELGY